MQPMRLWPWLNRWRSLRTNEGIEEKEIFARCQCLRHKSTVRRSTWRYGEWTMKSVRSLLDDASQTKLIKLIEHYVDPSDFRPDRRRKGLPLNYAAPRLRKWLKNEGRRSRQSPQGGGGPVSNSSAFCGFVSILCSVRQDWAPRDGPGDPENFSLTQLGCCKIPPSFPPFSGPAGTPLRYKEG